MDGCGQSDTHPQRAAQGVPSELKADGTPTHLLLEDPMTETRPAFTGSKTAMRSLAKHLNIDIERVAAADADELRTWIEARNNGDTIEKRAEPGVTTRMRLLELDLLR